MAGPFDGLINDQFRDCWRDAIAEITRGCGVPCRLILGVTRYDDCVNCIFDPIGNKSSNRYETGGPIPFSFGNCPMCAGAGKIPNEDTENIDLCIIYDYKKWLSQVDSNLRSPDGTVMSISPWSTREQLMRAKELIVNTDVEENTRARFERDGEPEPCGIGRSDYITIIWKRIENG